MSFGPKTYPSGPPMLADTLRGLAEWTADASRHEGLKLAGCIAFLMSLTNADDMVRRLDPTQCDHETREKVRAIIAALMRRIADGKRCEDVSAVGCVPVQDLLDRAADMLAPETDT